MSTTPDTTRQRYDYLIVGNSAAGISAAEGIRSIDATGSVGIVSDEDCPAYSTPLISYLVEGVVEQKNMNLRPADFYEKNSIDRIFGSAAVKLDAEAHELTLENGHSIGYGKLLLACGSLPSTPPTEGIGDQNNLFHFTRLQDATEIISQTKEAMIAKRPNKPVRAIVIGGGLTGLKAAEGLSQRVDEVVVLVRRTIMRSILDRDAADLLAGTLLKNNVIVMSGTQAQRIVNKDGRVCGVDLDDGTHLDCEILVVATGEKPNMALADDAGAETNKGLVCGPDMQTTLPDVYAAGDCAQSFDVLDKTYKTLALWPSALQQGKIAGVCMAGGEAEYHGNFAVNAIGFFGMSILACGTVNPKDDSFTVSTSMDDDVYTRFVTKDDRLYGYLLVNRPENAGIYTFLIRNELPISQLGMSCFERSIEMLDLPADIRWNSMHKGFDEREVRCS